MSSGFIENKLIKKPGEKLSGNIQHIKEFSMCADPVKGPKYFIENFFYIQHPTKGKVQFQPFDYQDDLIDVYHNYEHSINMLGRQMGKTTIAAGYLLWYAMFVPDSTILVASNNFRGSQEIMQRVRYAYENCPDHIRAGVTAYNKGSLEFDNSSRIVSTATTENTGRGMSISLLYLDELSSVAPNMAREFWSSISPTLSTGGKSIITSTPNTDDDQFWDIWTLANKTQDSFGNEQDVGINGYKAYKAIWNQHPDRDEEWGRKQREALADDALFAREHECEPVSFEETLINPMKLRHIEGAEPLYKQGQVRWYKRPEKDKFYILALDPSLGTGGDYSAITVFELPSLEQVAEWKHNKTVIQRQVAVLKGMIDHIYEHNGENWENIYYSVENNTLGEAALVVLEETGEENINGIFISESKPSSRRGRMRRGFNTTHTKKIAACSKLKSLVEGGKLKIKSKSLLGELKHFVAHGNSYQAKNGEHDDLVMSTLLALRIGDEIKYYDESLHTTLHTAEDDYEMPMPIIIV